MKYISGSETMYYLLGVNVLLKAIIGYASQPFIEHQIIMMKFYLKNYIWCYWLI